MSVGGVAVLTFIASAPLAAVGQWPLFRAGVELVVLSVTVERPAGRYLTGLQADDFRIYENGVAQPISFFGSTDSPIDLALMIDASQSVSPILTLARDAAVTLTRELRDGDRMAVYSFSQRAVLEQAFTNDHAAVEQAIDRIRPASTTAFYDAINVVLQDFASAHSAAPRRRALVVLSDGQDTSSLSDYDDVLERSRRMGVGIYTVALREPPAANDAVFIRRQAESAFELRALALETGARSFTLAKPEDLHGAYQSIAAELANQYCLAFVPRAASSSRFTRIQVAVDKPEAQVRTRSGYIGGTH